MIKEIPLLFSTSMVQAILEGRKTQTRRIINSKLQPVRDEVISGRRLVKPSGWPLMNVDEYTGRFTPYGKPGDVLWVRETWRPDLEGHDINDYIEKIRFAADGTSLPFKWVKDYNDYRNRPGIHMNKEYARIWLQVESVRVERLQDISEEDAINEGIVKIDYGIITPSGSASVDGGKTFHPFKPQQVFGYSENPRSPKDNSLQTARTAFGNLWQRINGPDSWAANPWVWCVKFKVLSVTGKPDLQTINK